MRVAVVLVILVGLVIHGNIDLVNMASMKAGCVLMIHCVLGSLRLWSIPTMWLQRVSCFISSMTDIISLWKAFTLVFRWSVYRPT